MDICVGVVILMESIPRSRMMNVMLCVRETRHKNAVDFGEVLFSPLVGSYNPFRHLISYTSNSLRLGSAADNDQRLKRFFSKAVLCVCFT